MSQPIVLIVNDDGFGSLRLARLYEALEGLGHRVVVAPEYDCSGKGHAISQPSRLRADEVAPSWWRVSGTPVDCAVLGALRLCPTVPDLVIAGANSDYNLGVDVLHSGTVGAASAAYLLGCSVMSVSAHANADLAAIAAVVRHLASSILTLTGHQFLNVNVPPAVRPDVALDRVRSTRLQDGGYELRVRELVGEDGRYYAIEGKRRRRVAAPDADAWAVQHGFVSVTSIRNYDLSRFVTRAELRQASREYRGRHVESRSVHRAEEVSPHADAIRGWLLGDRAQISGGEHDGGVLGSVSRDGSGHYVYPEIVGYYLTFLRFVAEETPRLSDRCAEKARRALLWLSRRHVWATRHYLSPPACADWRNHAVFTFDLGMLLAGIGHWAADRRTLDPASGLRARVAAELAAIRPVDGLLGSHRVRPGSDSSAIPLRWSSLPGPHHVKVAGNIHGALRGGENPELCDLADRTTRNWLTAADLDASHIDLHPMFYFLEGLVLEGVAAGRSLPPSLLRRALARILSSQSAEGDLAEQAYPNVEKRRADVTAQALRFCAIALGCGAAAPDAALDVGLRAGARGLCAALIARYLEEDGGIASSPVRGEGADPGTPVNVWATMFAYQALRFYGRVLAGEALAPPLLRLLI